MLCDFRRLPGDDTPDAMYPKPADGLIIDLKRDIPVFPAAESRATNEQPADLGRDCRPSDCAGVAPYRRRCIGALKSDQHPSAHRNRLGQGGLGDCK